MNLDLKNPAEWIQSCNVSYVYLIQVFHWLSSRIPVEAVVQLKHRDTLFSFGSEKQRNVIVE